MPYTEIRKEGRDLSVLDVSFWGTDGPGGGGLPCGSRRAAGANSSPLGGDYPGRESRQRGEGCFAVSGERTRGQGGPGSPTSLSRPHDAPSTRQLQEEQAAS